MNRLNLATIKRYHRFTIIKCVSRNELILLHVDFLIADNFEIGYTLRILIIILTKIDQEIFQLNNVSFCICSNFLKFVCHKIVNHLTEKWFLIHILFFAKFEWMEGKISQVDQVLLLQIFNLFFCKAGKNIWGQNSWFYVIQH